MFDAAPAIKPRVQGGRLKVFGVANKSESQAFAGLKPLAELGVPGFDATAWIALLAPAGTPDETVQVLNNAMQTILQDPQLKSKLAAIGNEVFIARRRTVRHLLKKKLNSGTTPQRHPA